VYLITDSSEVVFVMQDYFFPFFLFFALGVGFGDDVEAIDFSVLGLASSVGGVGVGFTAGFDFGFLASFSACFFPSFLWRSWMMTEPMAPVTT